MAITYLKKPWGPLVRKPPKFAGINWGHPLARGVRILVPFTEGGGAPVEMVKQTKTTINFTPTWVAAQGGHAGSIQSSVAFHGWIVGQETEIPLPLNRATVAVIRMKRDTTNRSAALFGCSIGANCLGAHVPYSDGTVYWDFGGQGAPNRLTAASLSFSGVEYWTFVAGYRGSAIYQNGILRASQSTAITRTNQAASTFAIGYGNNAAVDDLVDIYFFLLADAEWTQADVRAWMANPYGMMIPARDLSIDQFIAGSSAARVSQVVQEVLRDNDDPGGGNAKVSQVAREFLSGTTRSIFVSQVVQEVLMRRPLTGADAPLGTSWMVFQDASFDVWLRSGALSSAASDVDVLNGANLLLVGDEILQFKTVTSLGNNIYRLSRLLRGRFGTEWAMNTHAPGERVVLLTEAGIRRVGYSIGEIDAVRYWKAVSYKQTVEQAFARTMTDSGVALKPYAPVVVRGSRDGSNNLTITWVRRTRITGGWRDFVEVPLGEATESYEVAILNSAGTAIRTLTATLPTVTYTAAQQTTDFGSAQPLISVKVYQMSAVVGRGYPSSANI